MDYMRSSWLSSFLKKKRSKRFLRNLPHHSTINPSDLLTKNDIVNFLMCQDLQVFHEDFIINQILKR